MQNAGSPLTKANASGRQYVELDVTRLASGFNLRLGLHLVTGKQSGPTLGILTTIHGDETMALMAVRELLGSAEGHRFAAVPCETVRHGVRLAEEDAARLGIAVGDECWVLPLGW